MNRVMKRMTAGESILLGAALISSIYGMNFDSMPETHWSFGYPMAILSMVTLTVCLTATAGVCVVLLGAPVGLLDGLSLVGLAAATFAAFVSRWRESWWSREPR